MVELLLALAVLAILLVGAQSAIVLATKALPDAASPQAERVTASRALDMLSTDLGDAVSVVRAAPNEIEFTVPDRNGDGLPETIRYALTARNLRQTYNGAQEQVLLKKVASFALDYRTVAVSDPAGSAEGSEILLASNDSAVNLADHVVDSARWIGTSFRPVLPADATSWTLTRVKLKLRPNGLVAGMAMVQARRATADIPSAVVDDARMIEALLPAGEYSWQDFTFARSPRFNPGESAAVVVQWVNDAQACDVQYQNAGVAAANLALALTETGGSAWRSEGGKSLAFYAYGRITSPTSATSSKLLTAVHAALITDAGTHLRTTVRIPNEPKVEVLP